MRLLGIAQVSCALGLLAAGCGGGDRFGDEPDEPLIVDRPPATPGTPVDLNRPFDESGFFDFELWPQGCNLITDDELRTVLPQVEAVEREPRDVEMDLFGADGRRRAVTAHDSACVLAVDIPAAGLPAQSDEPSPPTVNVSVTNAGTPAVVDRNFSPPDETPLDVPGGECFPDIADTAIMCRADALSFRVSVNFDWQQKGPDGWRDRYRVDGETIIFSTADGAEATNGRQELARDTIATRLAQVILAKLPPRTVTPPPAG
jgi:hypothetical protein